MKSNSTIRVILFCFCIYFGNAFAQENSLVEWNNVLLKKNISQNDINKKAPHFPILKDFTSSKDLNKNIEKWAKKYREELDQLEKVYNISNDFSFVYLGVFSSKEYESYLNNKNENSWIEWVSASKISDRRLNEVAPHFPINYNVSKEDYNEKIIWWKTIYSHEYESLINSPELSALNPYYKGYVDLIHVPYFIGPLKSLEKPVKVNTGNVFNDKLNYELALMNWYFIFEPSQFKEKFGFSPVFSEGFNAEAYRIMNIQEATHHLNVEK